jgi:hypothetical protein
MRIMYMHVGHGHHGSFDIFSLANSKKTNVFLLCTEDSNYL